MSTKAFIEGWILTSQHGIESLQFTDSIPLPALNRQEVLVKLHAASLNSRDLLLTKGGPNLALGKDNLVPGSDGAGVVEAIGPDVTTFKVGDRVCTHLTYGLAEADLPGWQDISAGLGHTRDGTLRKVGIFHETSLVKMPENLDFMEAATLTCSGLTAWNALFGLESKSPHPGDTVLVQGTGGVSIAALQFALAAGATVIATTSSSEKAEKLKAIGAHHVVNYRRTPDWGQHVKALSADGKGAHVIVDVGGASTLSQSLKAVRRDGVIAATGILGENPSGQTATIVDCIFSACIARGLLLGSREQFQEMNNFIEKHKIKPILDPKQFDLSSVKKAYAVLEQQQHFSKIGIQLC